MKSMGKILCAVAVVLATGACAALGMRSSLSANQQAALGSIAVASVLGESFHGILEGVTAFNHKSYRADVAGWGVDAEAVRVASTALGKTEGRTVIPLSGAFPRGASDHALFAAKGAGAATLVVVAPARYDNQPAFVGGVGYHKKSSRGMNRDCIYSLLVVEAYDVNSGRRLAWQWGFDGFKGIPCYGADRNIPWKGDFAQYSEAEKAALRDAIHASIAANVVTGLRGLGL